MNKKAYLKTAEVLIAMVLGGAFIIYILPNYFAEQMETPKLNVLKYLESNEELRELFLLNQSECNDSDTIIKQYLPERFKNSHKLDIVQIDEAYTLPEEIPKDRNVYVDSLFISGNLTEYKPTIVRLYYWVRT